MRKWIVFVCLVETLYVLTSFSQHIQYVVRIVVSVICNLLSFSAATLHFGVFLTKNTTSQVPVDGFKGSVVRVREVSVL